jgi:arylsulfatase A-like enzyme
LRFLARALVFGLAFGLVAAGVEAWLNLVPTLSRGFGPGPAFQLRVAALEIGLAGALGLAAFPALALPAGRWIHLALLVLCWAGLRRWTSLDSPMFAPLELASLIAVALLASLGLWLASHRPRLAWGLAVVGLAAGLFSTPVALWALRPAVARRAELPPAPPDAPDVVLVVLDTVRAGNLSSYGYRRATGDALDALAREGALFLDATSPSTWSLPSHASLFTGRYPSSHRAHAEHRYLDDRYPTLAQVLAGNGYETFCITANAWISDGLGLTRGFAWQDESLRAHGGAGRGFSFIHRLLDRLGLQDADKGGDIVARAFERWASERPAAGVRPAFVFLNFIEAHFPYHQLPREHLFRWSDRSYAELRGISLDLLAAQFGGEPRVASEVRQPTLDMYDGGVAYTSELLGRVVAALRARGTLDRTLLVVLADHGEVLGERGGFFGHGPSLYQESIGVPLLVRYPPAVPAGVRVASPVSTLGVFATILDLAELPAPPTLQVGSLAPLIAGDGPTPHPGPILAELHEARAMGPRRSRRDPQMQSDRRYRMLREGPLKLVTSSGGDMLLYDLEADPSESRDLAAERPADLARMQRRLLAVSHELELPELAAAIDAGEAPPLDDETRARLRALGYSE